MGVNVYYVNQENLSVRKNISLPKGYLLQLKKRLEDKMDIDAGIYVDLVVDTQ